jgi:hypothetical protein
MRAPFDLAVEAALSLKQLALPPPNQNLHLRVEFTTNQMIHNTEEEE